MTLDEASDGATKTSSQVEARQTPIASTPNEAAGSISPDRIAQVTPHDKKIVSLEATIARLQSQIAETESQLDETREKLNATTSPNKADPEAIVKRHIRLLHEYNEIKDIGQGLMGLIADARGVRHVDVQAEFDVGPKD